MKRRGVRVVAQRKSWDCGVAALVMLTGESYGDVSAIVRAEVDPRKLRRRGLSIADVVDVASRFGHRLRVVYRSDGYLKKHSDGILGMTGGQMDKAGHWLILKAGVVVDPDGAEVWSVEDYTKRFQCRPTVLLVREDT